MIKVGDRVRSFDYVQGDFGRDLDGDRACYVEGIIEDLVEREGCPRYAIRVDYDVFGGDERNHRVGNLVYPPVNGTPTSFGGDCNYVELV